MIGESDGLCLPINVTLLPGVLLPSKWGLRNNDWIPNLHLFSHDGACQSGQRTNAGTASLLEGAGPLHCHFMLHEIRASSRHAELLYHIQAAMYSIFEIRESVAESSTACNSSLCTPSTGTKKPHAMIQHTLKHQARRNILLLLLLLFVLLLLLLLFPAHK